MYIVQHDRIFGLYVICMYVYFLPVEYSLIDNIQLEAMSLEIRPLAALYPPYNFFLD